MRNRPARVAYGWSKPRPLYPYAPLKAAHKRGGNLHAVPDTCDVRTWEDATARQSAMLNDPAHLAWLAAPVDADSSPVAAPPAPEPVVPGVPVAVDAIAGATGPLGRSELDRARAELVRLGVLVADSWGLAA